MKAAEHKLRVLEIDVHFMPIPSSRNEARFQLLLVSEDDHSCTSNVPLVKGRNFWWMSQKTFEAVWFRNADKVKAAAAAAAAAAAFVTAAAAAAAAHETTEKEKKIRTRRRFFEKTRGLRDGNAGHY
jgi:hypothetical protein